MLEWKWGPLSRKQKTVFKWWCHPKYKDKDGIIADGSIRSGKTISMAPSFVIWGMECFDRQNFALCGKTVGSLRRNVIVNLKRQLRARGYKVQERKTDNLIVVSKGSICNLFYMFGGKDESSQDLIQGITLAGAFFDEVALMPESFVNQATARCSVDGSKWWFNCNPAGPEHWFYKKWIKKAKKRNLLYLHFTMVDNLTLSPKIRKRYEGQYTGVFYQRYILGLWVAVEGLIYRIFDRDKHTTKTIPELEDDYYISSDYGMYNDNVFLLWRRIAGTNKYICLWELSFSNRDSQKEKGITQLVDDLEEKLDGIRPSKIIIDPSASAMIIELRKRGYKIMKADNDVLEGISDVQTMLLQNRLVFYEPECKGCISEFGLYIWDVKAAERGEDKPVKQHDHCITGDSLIETENGMVKIKDMVGTKGKVWSYSRLLKRKVLLPYRDCRKTQESVDVYEVTLDNGKKIRATSDHRVLTQNGYKPIKMLKTTDKLSCFN